MSVGAGVTDGEGAGVGVAPPPHAATASAPASTNAKRRRISPPRPDPGTGPVPAATGALSSVRRAAPCQCDLRAPWSPAPVAPSAPLGRVRQEIFAITCLMTE